MSTEVDPEEDSGFSGVKPVGSCKCCSSTIYQKGKNAFAYSTEISYWTGNKKT